MQIPVLIKRIESNGYRVTTGQPLALTAEGATREEAMQLLRQALQNRLRTGMEIATLELPAEPHPLLRYAGMFALPTRPSSSLPTRRRTSAGGSCNHSNQH